MSTTRRSIAALFAVMMLFVAGACSSGSSNAKKTSSDTSDSFSSDTGSSSDSASTDDTSFTDSGFSDSGFSDSGFSDSSSSGNTTSFCLAVDDIKQATKDLNAANSAGDDAAYKAGIQKAATAFQKLATYAPSSQQSDAQYIASFWSDFNDAVQATSPGDPARETARQVFDSKRNGTEVQAVDAYINQTC